jgi:hypothetical protein
MPPIRRKRQRPPKSFIWKHGWRLFKTDEAIDYWICKLCHTALKKPSNPHKFAYTCDKATSSAIEHLRLVHRQGPNGQIAPRRPQPSRSSQVDSQSSIEAYCEVAAERNRAASAFNYGTSRSLLTRLFTSEQLPLAKIDSPALRDLLVYLQPRYQAVLPTRNTLKRLITSTYDIGIVVVDVELQSATTKINLSFDL